MASINVNYVELLATLPAENWTSEDECQTCLENGFCRDRANALVRDIVHYIRCNTSIVVVDLKALLQWLLDNDEIGMTKDEIVEDLAERWIQISSENWAFHRQ